MRYDGIDCWFETRKVSSRNWEKIARRVNREWVSVKKGTKITFRDESILLPEADDDQSSPS